ncbi:hypothetical protein NDU88_004726 [Pleurodeles waltl]|uniref:Uncharacterized protein n=1 Tax=Pleurodeles waltl TaxID=8319 RepID=A0AAV7L286_PLEWA|nr:hypothetical protein NDU88_004726 [Pleurodeles waltl]
MNDDIYDNGPLEKRCKVSPSVSSPHLVSDDLVDHDGEPMYDPTSIHHPNSSEWFPSDHVSDYISFYLRHVLNKASRNKLKSERPRVSLPFKVAYTPSIDPNMLLFFTKFGKDPKKGVDRAWSNSQDRLLDLVEPLTRIFDLAEEAKMEGTLVDPEILKPVVACDGLVTPVPSNAAACADTATSDPEGVGSGTNPLQLPGSGEERQKRRAFHPFKQWIVRASGEGGEGERSGVDRGREEQQRNEIETNGVEVREESGPEKSQLVLVDCGIPSYTSGEAWPLQVRPLCGVREDKRAGRRVLAAL